MVANASESDGDFFSSLRAIRQDPRKTIGESALQALTNAFVDYGSLGAEIIMSPRLYGKGFGNKDAAAEFARLREERRGKIPTYEPSQETIFDQQRITKPVADFFGEQIKAFTAENPNASESIGDFFSDPRVAHTLSLLEIGLPSAPRAVKAVRNAPSPIPRGQVNKESGIINFLTGEDFDVQLMNPASTRLPSKAQQIKTGVNPHTRDDMLIDSSLFSPEKKEQLANIFREYPALRNIDPLDANAALEQSTDFMASNLDRVLSIMPDKWREQSQDWYNGFNRIAQSAAKNHGSTGEQAAGVIAALSPQTDWNVNLSRADRIMDTFNTRQDFPWSQEMSNVMPKMNKSISEKRYKEKLPNIVGKKLKDLDDPAEKAMWIRAYDEAHNPRDFYMYNPDGTKGSIAKTKGGKNREANWAATSPIEKSVRMLMDGSPENISEQIGVGHKVRSFYRNAADPTEPTTTTMDTHAVATALLQPLSAKAKEVGQNFGAGMSDARTGMKGTYAINQDAYNKVARKHGITGREVQSPTWEFGRAMMEGKKGEKYKTFANDVWESYADGKISLSDAQNKIVEAFTMPNAPY